MYPSPTRSDIHADLPPSDSKISDVPIMENEKMNRMLMAAAVVLISSAPLAFAATGVDTSNADAFTRHCANIDQQFSSEMRHQPAAAKQMAEEKADSMCRENHDHDKVGMNENRDHSPRLLVLR